MSDVIDTAAIQPSGAQGFINKSESEPGAVASPDYQRRTVKWYPLNDSDLRTLAVTEGIAGLLLTLASLCAGAWITIQIGIALITGAPPPSTPTLERVLVPLFGYGAIFFLLCALALIGLRYFTVRRIKRECTSATIETRA